MKANSLYQNKSLGFWGYVKFLSDKLGYSDRKNSQLKNYTLTESITILKKYNIQFSSHELTEIINYLNYRSNVLNNIVQHQLMDIDEVTTVYNDISSSLNLKEFKCKLPYNKQKGDKKNLAFFTCIINLITEQTLNNFNLQNPLNISFDSDPQTLTSMLDNDNKIITTLSRRYDGALPSTISPLAVWEIKEYYYTTTFGSRIADGIYETSLDGFEINQLDIPFKPKHYYFIDSKNTWWKLGKSYLCRIIDLLHIGQVSEVFFGKEILTQWPITLMDLLNENFIQPKSIISDYTYSQL